MKEPDGEKGMAATALKPGDEITTDQLYEWAELLYAEAANDADEWLEEFGLPLERAWESDAEAPDAAASYFEAACDRAELTPYLDPAYGVRAALEESYFAALDEHTEDGWDGDGDEADDDE